MSVENDKEWEEKCQQCIWHNDWTGKCEGTVDNMAFFDLSPFFNQHPELKGSFPLGASDDDCVGMEKRPVLKAVAREG